MLELKIDPEFKGKIPPLTTEEYTQLEENILKAGEIFNPIITWNGCIVDGHNRYNVYREHIDKVKEPRTREMNFSDRWEAIAWMCKNQIGQRNLTPEQKEYLIGKQYEAEKHSKGGWKGNRYTGSLAIAQNEPLPKPRVAERIAKEHGIGRESVKRAEHFAQALDKVAEIKPEFKDKVLRGEVKAPKTEIRELRNYEGEELKEQIAKVESGEYEKQLKEERKKAQEEKQIERKKEKAELEAINRIVTEQSGRKIIERTGADFLEEFFILFDEMKRTALRMIKDDYELTSGYVRKQSFEKMDETIKEIKENFNGN